MSWFAMSFWGFEKAKINVIHNIYYPASKPRPKVHENGLDFTIYQASLTRMYSQIIYM